MKKKLKAFITDCTDSKYRVVQESVGTHFGLAVEKGGPIAFSKDIETPLALEEFYTAGKKRLERLLASFAEGMGTHGYIIIQKGFFKEGGRWSIGGIVLVYLPNGKVFHSYLQSYPLPESVSTATDKDPNDSSRRVAAVEMYYPSWDKSTGIITGITKGIIDENIVLRNGADACLFLCKDEIV